MKITRKNLRADFSASIVVFLVALPLCLGIALASGAPLLSGLIAGIVAGVLVGWLSGSELSVSGPAAGLTVIVATQIQTLGAFDKFLAVVVIAGLLQIIWSLLRAGGLAGFFPSSVIQGMLAAIGFIIILKQIPHALGRDLTFEGDLSFFSESGSADNTFTDIVNGLISYHPGALIIALISIIILFTWPSIQGRFKALKPVPGPLVVVALGILANELFKGLGFDRFVIFGDEGHLVSIPLGFGTPEFFATYNWIDLTAFSDLRIYPMALTLALIGSIETLLCIEATDRLDPLRRISDTNRELLAQGLGNMTCGFLGGLPMTSVIVRSSANIYAGAQSRISGVLHGIWLLLALMVLAPMLNLIPLASLAAVLIVVGYKLTPLNIYKKFWREGIDQFLPFYVTVVAIVFSDLLIGVGVGVLVAFAMTLKRSYYTAIRIVRDGSIYLIKFTRTVSFLNKIKLKNALRDIPDGATVFIDGAQAMFIDHDIFDLIDEFKTNAKHRHIRVEISNIEGKQYPPSVRRRLLNGQL